MRRRRPGHLAAAHPQQVAAGDADLPVRGQLLADEEPDEGALAGAGGADEEDEVAAGDRDGDVGEGDLAVRVGHAHVHHADDRCIGVFGAGSAAQEGCHRSGPMVPARGASLLRL